MFTFGDLVRLDAAGIQLLLREVDRDQLAMSLKGAAEDVKDLFFSNMSERAGKMMREDMEAMGAVRLKDVDEAQAGVVSTAKALADAGEIVISTGDEESELFIRANPEQIESTRYDEFAEIGRAPVRERV